MSANGWIIVRNWDRFQHYKDRNPPWIKNYTDLLHNDDYLNLPPACRCLLHELWLEYASSNERVPNSTATLSRRFAHRVFTEQLERLNHAGFIEFAASPRARARRREEKRRTTTRSRAGKPVQAEPRAATGAYTARAESPAPVAVDAAMLEYAQKAAEQMSMRAP